MWCSHDSDTDWNEVFTRQWHRLKCGVYTPMTQTAILFCREITSAPGKTPCGILDVPWLHNKNREWRSREWAMHLRSDAQILPGTWHCVRIPERQQACEVVRSIVSSCLFSTELISYRIKPIWNCSLLLPSFVGNGSTDCTGNHKSSSMVNTASSQNKRRILTIALLILNHINKCHELGSTGTGRTLRKKGKN
jgi:hypothetical protein